MLRFERDPLSKTIRVKLRDKKAFWSSEFFFAIFIALLLHISAPLLFKIKSITPQAPHLSPLVRVNADFFSPLIIDETAVESVTLAPPPRPPLPLNSISHVEPADKIVWQGKKNKAQIKAYLRGENPLILNPPRISSETAFLASLTLRSDLQGNLIWFDWLEKPNDLSLIKTFEVWLKELKFLPQHAFKPLFIEVHFFP